MREGCRNVEIKLRCPALDSIALRLRDELGARDMGVLEQQDFFFPVPRGRLKLRRQARRRDQLIAYVRADAAALRPSDYRIVECDEGEGLRQLLAATLGEIGTVRKRRHLFLLDNVRIHLDQVDGLGSYLEIEAVLDAAHDEAECAESARRVLRKLGLEQAPVESLAYIDLLAKES